MPLPTPWAQIPILASRQYNDANGTPVTGFIYFVSKQIVAVTGATVSPIPEIIPQPIKVPLINGLLPSGFTLPATNDPSLNVTGWAYEVVEDYPGAPDPYYIFVPYDTPASGLDLSTVSPVVPPPELEGALSVAVVQAAQGFADDAQASATTATGAATTATSAAGIATGAAATATTEAGIATTQAGAAAGSAAAASQSAGNATTQAGLATGAATAASQSAGTATTQATAAAASAAAALASQNAAGTSATSAASSATASAASVGALTTQLADGTTPGKGAALVAYLTGTVKSFLDSMQAAGSATGAALLGFLSDGVNATAQTLLAKVREYRVSNTSFAGLGITDDQAILLAFNALLARPTGGQLLINGNVNLTAPVFLDCAQNPNGTPTTAQQQWRLKIICNGTITPASGIGAAITVANAYAPEIQLDFQGGGGGASDYGFVMANVRAAKWSLTGKNYAGIVWNYVAANGTVTENRGGRIHASGCTKAFAMTGGSSGFGSIDSIWDVYNTTASFIRSIGDLTIKHFETTSPSTRTDTTQIYNCNSINFGQLLLGLGGSVLLTVQNTVRLNIEKLYLFGGNLVGGTTDGMTVIDSDCYIADCTTSGVRYGVLLDGGANVTIGSFYSLTNQKDWLIRLSASSNTNADVRIASYNGSNPALGFIDSNSSILTGTFKVLSGKTTGGNSSNTASTYGVNINCSAAFVASFANVDMGAGTNSFTKSFRAVYQPSANVINCNFAEGGLAGSSTITSPLYIPSGKSQLGSGFSVGSIANNQSAWGVSGAIMSSGGGAVTDTTSPASATVGVVTAMNGLAQSIINATNASVTYAAAATHYIAGPPIAGTNATISSAYAIYVASGASRFQGQLVLAGNQSLAAWGTNGPQLFTGSYTYTNTSTAASTSVSGITSINTIGSSILAATNTAVTFPTAASLYLAGPPTAGANATITNAWTIYINSGPSYFGGMVTGAQTSAIVNTTVTVTANGTNHYSYTLNGNTTFANPTGLVAGTKLKIAIYQNGIGGFSITFGSMFKFPGGVTPTWNTAANGKNFIAAYYDGTNIFCYSASAF